MKYQVLESTYAPGYFWILAYGPNGGFTPDNFVGISELMTADEIGQILGGN